MARQGVVIEVKESIHGVKHIIDGSVVTPSDRRIYLRTVWIIEGAGQFPRFVTAYPA